MCMKRSLRNLWHELEETWTIYTRHLLRATNSKLLKKRENVCYNKRNNIESGSAQYKLNWSVRMLISWCQHPWWKSQLQSLWQHAHLSINVQNRFQRKIKIKFKKAYLHFVFIFSDKTEISKKLTFKDWNQSSLKNGVNKPDNNLIEVTYKKIKIQNVWYSLF